LAVIAWILTPRYGIAGVGLAILFDGLLVFILAAWRLWALHRFAIARTIGWLAVGMVFLIASCGMLAVRLPSDTGGSILIKCAICLLLALLGLKILREKDHNRDMMNYQC
jgi:O-antigen/teichoic acid export membrane protein